ncbi:MAG: hypothetical protein Kow0010_24410 [Dehalococcoidia bacterium]
MANPTLFDLVANRTMSPGMAATLATAAAERRSFVGVAIPRLAGKTTVMEATLAFRPDGMPVHRLSAEAGPGLGIPADPRGEPGYLLMGEISEADWIPGYLWGEPVRRVFAAVHGQGFALATALHAGGIGETFEIICGANFVPDEHASCIDLVYYIRSLGPDWRAPTRRVLAELHEVEAVSGGRPVARLVHRWDEASDTFEDVDSRRLIDPSGETWQRHFAAFSARAP